MLPARQIVISEEHLALLNENVWSDAYVPASLVSGGKKESIRIRYRGGHTREYPKKSYDIVHGGKLFHLNAEFDDPSLLRNALSFRFFEWIGVPAPQTRHCLLEVNGRPKGVYLEIEAVDRRFFKRRGIAVHSLVYAINNQANFGLADDETNRRKASLFKGYQMVIGTREDRIRLQAFIRRLNTLTGKRLLAYLSSHLDVDQYLRWLAGAVFTGNYDGFTQNYSIYRTAKKPHYRMIPWDYEGTWGRNCYGRQCSSDLVSITGYNHLTGKLLAFRSVRQKYKALLREILGQSFTLRKITPVLYEMHHRIAPYVYEAEHSKWAEGVFEREPLVIQQYIQERRRIIARGLAKL